MSTEQLAKLKQALRAVQGEAWDVRPGGCQVTVEQQTNGGLAHVVVAETFNPRRASFIATCDPATVGELLALAEQALRA